MRSLPHASPAPLPVQTGEGYDLLRGDDETACLEVSMDDAFATAMAVLKQGAHPDDYSESFLMVFPVDGASVSTLGDVLGTEIVSSTDADARRLDELQFDLGEGPCWDAMRLGAPISEIDLIHGGVRRWPAFAAAATAKVSAASVFAFPVAVGSLRFGAVDLFARQRLTLSSDQTRQATAMAQVIGHNILRDAVDKTTDADPIGFSTRRVVHHATGVVLAQLELTAEEAQLVIQGHAFATGRAVTAVASDIVERRLAFRRVDGEIEAVR